jgi:hypothetical protein
VSNLPRDQRDDRIQEVGSSMGRYAFPASFPPVSLLGSDEHSPALSPKQLPDTTRLPKHINPDVEKNMTNVAELNNMLASLQDSSFTPYMDNHRTFPGQNRQNLQRNISMMMETPFSRTAGVSSGRGLKPQILQMAPCYQSRVLLTMRMG